MQRNQVGTRSAAGQRRESGFTILEVMVAAAVLATALMGVLAALIAADTQVAVSQEHTVAMESARQMLEQLQGLPLAEVVRRYDTLATDDPGGAGTAPGSRFAVPGLQPVAGAPAGMCGTVLFPGSDGPTGCVDETVVNAIWATPRDLDGNGLETDAAVAPGDVLVLPVTIRVRWQGTMGEQTIEIHAFLR